MASENLSAPPSWEKCHVSNVDLGQLKMDTPQLLGFCSTALVNVDRGNRAISFDRVSTTNTQEVEDVLAEIRKAVPEALIEWK